MSSAWDDESEERPRRRVRRDDDYDDVARPPRGSTGAVTAVGVITIILGALSLLGGLCFTVVFMVGAANVGRGPGAMVAGIGVVFAIVGMIIGGLYLSAGVGVLQRRNWGRILTLVLAGLGFALGLLQIIGLIMVLAGQPFATPHQRLAQMIGGCIGLLINFGYGIFAFVVLLNSDNAEEFH